MCECLLAQLCPCNKDIYVLLFSYLRRLAILLSRKKFKRTTKQWIKIMPVRCAAGRDEWTSSPEQTPSPRGNGTSIWLNIKTIHCKNRLAGWAPVGGGGWRGVALTTGLEECGAPATIDCPPPRGFYELRTVLWFLYCLPNFALDPYIFTFVFSIL